MTIRREIARRFDGGMRPQKITFGEMREIGVRGILVYCADYRCSHSRALNADRWPDELRLSDIEPRFVCRACGKRGADVGRTSIGISRQLLRGDIETRLVEARPIIDTIAGDSLKRRLIKRNGEGI